MSGIDLSERSRDLESLIICAQELRRMIEDADGTQISESSPSLAIDLAYVMRVNDETKNVHPKNIFVTDTENIGPEVDKASQKCLNIVSNLLEQVKNAPQIWTN